ncbi:MAG: hypothetical protein JWN44_375 [Myxococcales bacterium]|nr:hypothetical protein [Myxococcales bacterium]
MRAFAAALALAVHAALALTAAGCSSAASGTLSLDWRLSDGRDCFTAGTVNVELRTTAALGSDALASFVCTDGLAPASVSVDAVPGSGTLYLDARSILGADLYHGELSLSSAPPGTGELRTVTLYAVAAE